MDPRAALPAVGRLVARDDVRALIERHGRDATVEALRAAIEAARSGHGEPSPEAVVASATTQLTERARGTLVPVINATGVVLHTNLGRAPLGEAARAAIAREGSGYVALEIDLPSGGRGSRHAHARARLSRVTGAEDALVANNAAAALLLALSALAPGARVIVSRGELVEIGGAFRIPEIVETGGARLVEVGTTNRTRLADYERAITDESTVLLKVHRSNFAMVGFTEEASLEELVALGARRGCRVVYDLGSGLMVRGAALGLPDEPDVPGAVASGADVVVFSGDKLLGGPQAGLAVGRGAAIEAMRRHPLMRALRGGKLVLAALDATLAAYERGHALDELPTLARLVAGRESVRARCERLRARVGRGEVVDTVARVGAGAQPTADVPSAALRLEVEGVDAIATRLRNGSPAVVPRVEGGALFLDLRAVADDEVEALAGALGKIFAGAL
ncbi:MAG: L-seryl-tRNA(Sec) selenium transferase [Myxococcales bacterium]|nr:L-seryl-tRNA(Sec) selenium transferase [Myxococcales bacterium]